MVGASFPNDFDITFADPNIISTPDDGYGLITFPDSDDFIVTERCNFDKLAVLEVCLNEMSHISNGVMSPRAGAAGGFMLPSSQSKSLSKCTQSSRLLTKRKHSVGMSLSYMGSDNLPKGRNSIYSDLKMRRLSSSQKFKKVLKSEAQQRLLITEMISRLRTFIIFAETQILLIPQLIYSFLQHSPSRSKYESHFISQGKSKLESKILSWACSTGEMRNHMSVRAHCNGNKCHPVETMTLFGRVAVNSKNMNTRMLNDIIPSSLYWSGNAC